MFHIISQKKLEMVKYTMYHQLSKINYRNTISLKIAGRIALKNLGH
jgi:hypothetical protein